MLQVKCPACKQLLNIPDGGRGQTLRCPKCKAAFRVPDLPAPTPGSQPPRPPLPTAAPEADDRYAFDDRGAAPPRRPGPQRPAGRTPTLVMLVACANLAVGVLGLACCGCGGLEYVQNMRFSPTESGEGLFHQHEWETELKDEAASYNLFQATDVCLRLGFASLLIASGAGLFALQGWARALALAYTGVSILSKLVFIAALVVYFLPFAAHASAEGVPWLIAYAAEYLLMLAYPALVLVVLMLPGVRGAFRARAEWKERQWKDKQAERGEPEAGGVRPPAGRVVVAGAMCLAVGAADFALAMYRALSFVGGAAWFQAMEKTLPGYTLSVIGGIAAGVAMGAALAAVGIGLLFRGRWARWAAVGLAAFVLLAQFAGVLTQVLWHSPAVESVQLNSSIEMIPPGFCGNSPPSQNLQTVFLGGLNLAAAAALAGLMLAPGTAAVFAPRRRPGDPLPSR
jgi:hypothetical protein